MVAVSPRKPQHDDLSNLGPKSLPSLGGSNYDAESTTLKRNEHASPRQRNNVLKHKATLNESEIKVKDNSLLST